MYGFCGFTGLSYDQAEPILNAMLNNIKHRAPRGSTSEEVSSSQYKTYFDANIAFGSVGISSHECEKTSDNYIIVFNGNIYNIAEIRAELENKGLAFDTVPQMLIHLYQLYDTEMLVHLRGMFAFAIYDTTEEKLFCARDPFGAKPFYYMHTDTNLIFGSEIKSFLPHPCFIPEVNTGALAQYLTFQYSVLTETFFKGVYKLPAGHYMVYTNGNVQISKYHSYSFTPENMSLSDAVNEIDEAVCESVELHMESDTEIGAFLSGGVDSGYIAATFGKKGGNKTFTVGFDYEKYNETQHAKNLSDAIGLEHITKIISTDEYWDSLAKVQYHMDEPLADPAAVAFYFACKEAANHVKIALSGEAADEFFGGYNIYKEPHSLRLHSRLPLFLRRWLAGLAMRLPKNIKGRNFLIRGAKTVEERFIGNAYIFSPEERDKLLKHPATNNPSDITQPYYQQVSHLDDITKMQFLDINLWLTDDILLQADKMSMAHGLEVRTPFLDLNVFNVASRLPVTHRVTKKETKVAFRQAAARHLPPQAANRHKLGFPVPIRIWLREEKYYNIVKTHFVSEVAAKYFNVDELMQLLDQHYSGNQDNSRKIWTVYMFLIWHNEFMEVAL